jgi:hypothetical protein
MSPGTLSSSSPRLLREERRALRALLALLDPDGPEPAVNLPLVAPELVVRRSVAPPAQVSRR